MKIIHKVIRRQPSTTPNGKTWVPDPKFSAEEEAQLLDQQAAEGWELVSVAMTTSGGQRGSISGGEIRYYFRRQIPADPYRESAR